MEKANYDPQYATVELMLELVRAAVLEQEPKIPEGVIIDWDKLMDVSLEQSVLPWVWEGICKLPGEQQPPRQQRINWGLSAQECINTYFQQKEVLNQIVSISSQNNIRVLLLKGIGLSELYPKPSLRMCGDIDIYLFDDYEKGNQLFCKGDFVFGAGDKHANFKYRGVVVENHKTLINTNTLQQRRVESYLENTLGDVEHSDLGYYVLSPMANVIFLLMHSLSHMESRFYLSMRQILDFGLLLHKNRNRIDSLEFRRVLHQIKMSKQFELLLSVSEKILGVDFSEYHDNIIPKDDVQSALKMLFDKNTSIEIPFNIPFWEQIKLRKAYNTRMKWKYHYIPFSKYSNLMRIYKPPISHLVKQIFRH